MKSESDNNKDIFRDTPIRYLGYANEVGEAFRSLVHVSWVRFSYGVASVYVLADAADKGRKTSQKHWPDDSMRKKKIVHTVVDTVVWQGLASVAIPGFTINRICALSRYLLARRPLRLPINVQKWTSTFIGLGSIPFIIKPIDRSVDYMMNKYPRRWFDLAID